MSAEIEARRDIIESSDKSAWHAVLAQCGRYDIYHTSEYHRLAEINGEGKAQLFVFREGDSLVALPYLVRELDELAWIESNGFRDASSVYGYAGPVSNVSAVDPKLSQVFIQALRAHMVEQNIVSLFSRLHPILENDWLVNSSDNVVYAGKTVSIQLSGDSDPIDHMPGNLRRDIRNASKRGIVVEQDSDFRTIDSFVDAYNETMRRNRAASIYFFPREYFQFIRTEMAGNSRLFMAKDDGGDILSWVLVFTCNDTIQYHLSATPDRHARNSATKSVLHHIACEGTEQGFRRFHLGGGLGGSEEDGLFRFKRGFSSHTHEFKLLKFCANEQSYSDLCSEREKWVAARFPKNDQTDAHFFPAYRAAVPVNETPL